MFHFYIPWKHCKPRVKIRDSYISWSEILFWVPHESIPGLLLFNIFVSTCFNSWQILKLQIIQMTRLPLAPNDGKSIVEELETSSSILFAWLRNSYMKANTDESYLSLFGNNNLIANTDGSIIADNQVLLGINIDFNLKPK